MDDEPKFKSPSYQPAECCRGVHCWMAGSSTAEHPCWGSVRAIEEDGDGEDWWWIHGCEGHADYPAGTYRSAEQAAAEERAYKDQRDALPSPPPIINYVDALPPEEKEKVRLAIAELCGIPAI